MDVYPGPIPKDGEGITPDVDLPAMVNGTSLENFEKDQFVNTWAPFVVSATDAPASSTRVPGMLWFKRGEGRMYMWNTQLPIVSAGNAGSFFLEGETGAMWQCISDRKELYCRCWNDALNNVEPGPIPGYGIVCAAYGASEPDIRYLIAGGNPKWWGPHVQKPEEAFQSGKFWLSVTNYTVASDHVAGGMYHDIGYRRARIDSSTSGPNYGWMDFDGGLKVQDPDSYDPYMENVGNDRVVAQITHSGPPKLDAASGTYLGLVYWWPESTRTQWGQ